MNISRGCAATALAALIALPAGAAEPLVQRYVHNGVAVEMSLAPGGRAASVMEGEFAELRFRIADEASGAPLRAAGPGAWMDMAQAIQGPGPQQKSCKDKIALYLKGVVGIRPMMDLNSYYVLLLNADASVSVVDPVVSMAGVTSTLASVALKAPGADWVESKRERRLYISMPRAGQVAVLDTETFKLIDSLAAGDTPVRVALQPDGRYLWVGNNAADAAASGVSVIDTQSGRPVGFVATGAGHHEIAFSGDSRRAFVSNRNAGTVSVIEVATREVLKTLHTGSQPLSLAYSPLGRTLYVADGKDGRVTAIDTDTLEVAARIDLAPGLGPLRVSPDGRYALALNAREDVVHVIDVASHERVEDVGIVGQPFQLVFSASYAYVRALHSERVSMISLASLGKGRRAVVQSFAAGAQPLRAGGAAIADSVASAPGEGTVFVVNPADGATYYYMEGMNATSTSYRVQGSSPRAVAVVDRGLKEVEPGVYAGRVRIPVAGSYDVAFMLQSPPVLHCFSAEAAANPAIAGSREPVRVEYATTQRQYPVGGTAAIRFRLYDSATGAARTGLADALRALSFLAPGRLRSEHAVSDLGEGLYEARIALPEAGAWYVHIGLPALGIGWSRLPYFSLQAVASGGTRPPVAAR